MIRSLGSVSSPQLLDFADVGRMLGRTLVHRRHQGRIGDVNDVLLVVEDVVRGILVDARLAADADGQHRRLWRDERKGAERGEIEHARARQAGDPGDRARHHDAGDQPVGGFGVEVCRVDSHREPLQSALMFALRTTGIHLASSRSR